MYRDLYVFCWYVCRLFVMNYGAVSTNQEDPFCFQRILLFLTRAQKNVINKILQAQGCDIHRCLTVNCVEMIHGTGTSVA